MSLDLRALYPNFHAETHKHGKAESKIRRLNGSSSAPALSFSSIPSPTKTPPLTTTARDVSSTRRASLGPTARPRTSNQKETDDRSDTRPSTQAHKSAALLPPTRGSSRRTKLEGSDQTQKKEAEAEVTRRITTSRGVGLRGNLAFEPSSRPITPAVATSTSPSVGLESMSNTARTQDRIHPVTDLHDIVWTARPRSRYARRETIQPLHRIASSSSFPVTPSSPTEIRPLTSSGALGTNAVTASLSVVAPPLVSWTERDASSFFLTEIDAKVAADQWTVARAIARGSHHLYAQDEFQRAISAFGEALPLAVAANDKALLSLLHHHMGVAFKEEGKEKWALLMQKKSLELAQECHDLRLQGRALKALGVLFLDRRDAEKALDCQQQALQIATDTKDKELEARVYANLGNLASAQLQMAHAILCHQRDLTASQELDSAVGQARAHRNLALVYAKLNQDAGTKARQLDHELNAARIIATSAFETDMRRHLDDSVGNIYFQITKHDSRITEMVASSLQDILSEKTERSET